MKITSSQPAYMRFALTIATAVALLSTNLRAQSIDAGRVVNEPVGAPVVIGLRNATTATPPTVQPSGPSAARKDPETATAYAALLPGGGQLYAGRTAKGLGLLGVSAGAVVAGAALKSNDTCTTVLDSSGNLFTTTCTKGKRGPLYAGIGVAVASWLYGLTTAAGDARDANEDAQRHARATPMLERTGGRTELGLAYRF